jgi:hypothetical protein
VRAKSPFSVFHICYKLWHRFNSPSYFIPLAIRFTLSKSNMFSTTMASSTLLPIFLLSTLLVSSQAYSGSLAPQVFQKRATYNGGWPLGLSGPSCPAEAPVACQDPAKAINPTCCPTGQTCFGFSSPYCCPTGTVTFLFPIFFPTPKQTSQLPVPPQNHKANTNKNL